MEAISLIKQKNCEGMDRIPQRIIVDGISILIKPLTELFNSIYVLKRDKRSLVNFYLIRGLLLLKW